MVKILPLELMGFILVKQGKFLRLCADEGFSCMIPEILSKLEGVCLHLVLAASYKNALSL